MSQRRSNQRNDKKNKFDGMPLWQKIVLAIGGIILMLGLIVGGVGIYWISTAPDLGEKDLTGSIASTIYDANGNSVYETSANERIIVDESDISQQTFDAVTSIEDRRFLKHNGFDLRRIIGSALANLRAGGISQGGSTLTQQLVKLSVFSTNEEDQTYKRKVQEIWLAYQLENKINKQEIFEYYINKVYMSNGVYGMGTAAEIYYGRPLNELNLAETALLAGMPQAPNTYDPYQNPEQAKERRDDVLYAMLENDKISQEEYDQAVNTPVDEGLLSLEEHQQTENANDLMLDAYVQQVADEVKAEGYDIFTDGLSIYTHLDTQAQSHIFNTIQDNEGAYFPDERMQAAASVLDTETGHIVALVGGRQYEDRLSLNRASNLERSVGSSIKPFSSYGPAIEYLNYSTDSSIVDEKHEYSSGMEIYNWDRRYQGMLTLRQALAGSRNVPALKLIQNLEKEVGIEKVDEFLKNVGIQVNNGEGVYESNALGGEATPLALSAAYATLGNYGQYNEPKAVDYFVNPDGQEISVSGESRQAMADSTAYMLTDMLKDSFTDREKGLLTAYHTSGLNEAGKSGTTNYSEEQMAQLGLPDEAVPDTWMSGYTTDYSVSIWTGYDNPTSTDEKGYLIGNDRNVANQLYQNFMSYFAGQSENADWQQPESVHEIALEFGAVPTKFATSSTPSSRRINGLANDALYDDYVNNRQQKVTQEAPPVSSFRSSSSEVSSSVGRESEYSSYSESESESTVEEESTSEEDNQEAEESTEVEPEEETGSTEEAPPSSAASSSQSTAPSGRSRTRNEDEAA
ncbi:transglycosylase domain-containing protein [Aerococcus kribbianus]|uniref:Transglycosylase domain-containing protein n=1 Tax=Aerococcus kribbianus TaxID=2999064 RepID=A0A9X3FN88_9LACT|nr:MULTISPECIES: transglycosylase domain-containing protein [unclassified Aerococcus]MCZ0716731.1 transglycosylase domain-containing protein [Aerococcus sp. YH-aer221]MCZ0725019.1 transglycosylase domain-containing protein [Aerococcus sp. YH-aer222]